MVTRQQFYDPPLLSAAVSRSSNGPAAPAVVAKRRRTSSAAGTPIFTRTAVCAMQRSLKRFVTVSEKQRQSQAGGELPTAARPASQRQHSSRLVQVLNSQLRRPDNDEAQPGPATLVGGRSCSSSGGATTAGSAQQQLGACERDTSAAAPCSPAATRACPICGKQWAEADFEAHLTQELLALEEEEAEDGTAQAPLPAPPPQPSAAPHGPCLGGLQQPQLQPQQRMGSGSLQAPGGSSSDSGGAGPAQQRGQQPHPQQPPSNALQPARPLQHRQQHGQPPRLRPAAKKQRVLVLGGRPQETAPTDPRTLQWRQRQRQQRRQEEERAGALSVFNHYSDGAGFWDSEDIGIDGAENAGLQWEGMGTCNL